MKKIAIIGGGVAGLTTAIYALRANADVVLFEQYGLGGLVSTIDKIENYPACPNANGFDLANDMASQAKSLGLQVLRQKVVSVTKDGNKFVVVTNKDTYFFSSVVVATGTAHNKLGYEADYVGRGVSYCATCDGNFYRNRNVVVVGGGNVAVSEATYLSGLCASVTVICPSQSFVADGVAVSQLLAQQNVSVIFGATVTEIVGKDVVEGVQYFDGDKLRSLQAEGVFVAVGAKPVTEFVKMPVQMDNGYLVVDDKCQTSVQGLFACGDVTNGALKQIVTACADGAKAGTFATVYARKNEI